MQASCPPCVWDALLQPAWKLRCLRCLRWQMCCESPEPVLVARIRGFRWQWPKSRFLEHMRGTQAAAVHSSSAVSLVSVSCTKILRSLRFLATAISIYAYNIAETATKGFSSGAGCLGWKTTGRQAGIFNAKTGFTHRLLLVCIASWKNIWLSFSFCKCK